MEKRTLNVSKEDYLEAILIRIKEDGACRVTDIAKQVGYSKASTSVALNKLEEEGCIQREDWRIVLTEKGQNIAQSVYEKHQFFYKWFIQIGVNEQNAMQDACMIEHVLSEETFEKIKLFIQNSSVDH